MSIIADTPDGWLLCHYKLLISVCQPKEDLFNVITPFLMDSAALKLARLKGDACFDNRNAEKCRKRLKLEKSEDKDKEKILQAFHNIVQLGLEMNYLDSEALSEADWLDNNKAVRQRVHKLDPGVGHLLTLSEKLSKTAELDQLSLLPGASTDLNLTSLTLVKCESPEAVVITLMGQRYIIPRQASFVLGDVFPAVEGLVRLQKKFDIILLDPPWLNKSVRRKKKYWMVEMENLPRLRIPDLAETDCLVAVWTTNNADQNAFVTDVLFPAWSVTFLTTWHWIKITKKGQPVTSFESAHKKPFENLILGRFHPQTPKDNQEEKPITKKVFMSIPSIIHSHKPPISEILRTLLAKENPSGLELFARYLLPDWTSCGNEVLKLQHLNYFHKD